MDSSLAHLDFSIINENYFDIFFSFQIKMYNKCRSTYRLIFMFFVFYLILTGFVIIYRKIIFLFFFALFCFFFLVKSNEDIKPWEQLFEIYPGLVEPIRESWNNPLSIRKIYMVTPTKTRAEQTADLTRLAQTLYLVKNNSIYLSFYFPFLDSQSFLDNY